MVEKQASRLWFCYYICPSNPDSRQSVCLWICVCVCVCACWLTNEAYTSQTKWPRVSSSPLAIAYFTWHRAGKCEVKSSQERACFGRVSVCVCVSLCARPGREDDSKCHLVGWGQPSQTHSSCRRCCHPPPHCLCKWCLQSPSSTWRFHPSPRSPWLSPPQIVQIVPSSFFPRCSLPSFRGKGMSR